MSLLLSVFSTAWAKAVFLKMLSCFLLSGVVFWFPFWTSWRCSDDNSWKQPLWTNSVDQNGSITWKALPSTCGCQGIIMNNLYYIPTIPILCMCVLLSCICSVDVGEIGLFLHTGWKHKYRSNYCLTAVWRYMDRLTGVLHSGLLSCQGILFFECFWWFPSYFGNDEETSSLKGLEIVQTYKWFD